MPATYTVYEKFTGRDASDSIGQPRSLNRSFEVYCDDNTVAGSEVIAATVALVGCAKGTSHPKWAWALCHDLKATPHEDSPTRWDVDAIYTEPSLESTSNSDAGFTTPPSGSPAAPTASTTLPQKGSFRIAEKYEAKDLDGKQYLNTAKVPLENPPPRTKAVGSFTLIVKYNWATTSVKALMAKLGNVNNAAWAIFSQYECRISGFDFTVMSQYLEVAWLIEYNEDLWYPVFVSSIGRYSYKRDRETGDTATVISPNRTEALGEIISEPVCLDAWGVVANMALGIGAAQPGHPVAAGTPMGGGPALVSFKQNVLSDFATFLPT